MLFSKPCLFVLFSAFLRTANADTIRGVQQRELQATPPKVDLGTAGNYVIFASTGISTVPPSAITGDIAVSPIAGAAMTGFSFTFPTAGTSSLSSQLTGSAYASDYLTPTPTVLIAAAGDMVTAYNDAAGRPNADGAKKNLGAGEIGSKTLTHGVYTFTTDVAVSTKLTFEGSSTDVFIIQMSGSLKVAANVQVILAGNARAENIFWQVAGSVKVQAGAHMKGILLVMTDALFVTGSSLDGRVFAQTACNLQQATITNPAKLAE